MSNQDHETLPEAAPLRGYFSVPQWLVFSLIILAGILLRWLELDVRPYHHDESQHAMFGKYFYDFPDIQHYKYDPMMHAPLLYNFFRLVYTALGNTLWSARAPIALIGTIFLFLPLLFRRYFSPPALLVLISAISLSPSMVYWSRFVIHDFFVLSAMFITLYGVVLAAPHRKSFFVILGIVLQFCIKANVFVTLAMILGYLVHELLLIYFSRDYTGEFFSKLFSYLRRYFLAFFASFAVITIFLHYEISQLTTNGKIIISLKNFAANIPLFILSVFLLCGLGFLLSFFILDSERNYFRAIFSNIRRFPKQFAVSSGIGILVFCYIFSSGFRHMKGILDGLYRTSIPYWLNQHDIERIKGPFLFNFYMFSWYEFAFLLFFIAQLFLFYRNAARPFRIAGAAMLATALFLSYVTLLYIRPDASHQHWLSMEEIGGRQINELTSWTDRAITSFIHIFKLKDCLDVIGLILLLVHPVILTTAHILRGERILAFWGYMFTASFFTYSFLGEKVPWLSMYPLIMGFVYLTLFFDRWFRDNPIPLYRDFSLSKLFQYSGIACLSLALIFLAENIFSISAMLAQPSMSKFFGFFTVASLEQTLNIIKSSVWENLLLFLIGFVFYILHVTNHWTGLLGSVNLFRLVFVVTALFCLRMSILTNFVYGGSETQFISQVHTTKEFHEIALRLRHEALTNIRPDEFKLLGDGDPVWPLTWYMVGVNSFKFNASPAERKSFDIIIQTYDEEIKNVPENFEKRRITLRGWWVPDYNQMTFRKFLNVAVNHIPWSPSGFTYAWMLINRDKS